MLVNFVRMSMLLGLATLIISYNFQLNGWIGAATNICFFFIGFLIVSTWKKSDPECLSIEEEIELSRYIPEESLEKAVEEYVEG